MNKMSEAAISFPLLGENFSLDFKPYFTVFGFQFHWYGIIIAVGFLLAVFYAIKRSKQFGLTEDNIIDLLIFSVPLAIIGARLYYVIFSWDEYKDNFLAVFKIWEGGLAIYGGIIGAVIGLIIFSKVKKVKLGAAADVGGLGLLIGQAIGRWGNFVNREVYGLKTTVPWRMGLTNQYGTFYYHPCFLYESLWNILGFVLLHFYSKKRKFDGEVFCLYLAWYGLGRAFIESLRQPEFILKLFGSNLSVSQLIAILTVICAIALVLFVRLSRNPEPEDLWANRELKAQLEKAAADQAAAARVQAEEELYDEDFASALELLKHGTVLDDEDDMEDGPVMEPINVVLSDEMEDDASSETDI